MFNIAITNTDNYGYNGQASTRSYFSSTSGVTNPMLVVVVTGSGFAAIPSVMGITYNGVAMTARVSTSPGYSGFANIWTLSAPASGYNTLAVNFSNGSNGQIYVTIYSVGNTSNAPIDIVASRYTTSGGSNGNWLSVLNINQTSAPTICIDGATTTDSGTMELYPSSGSGQTQVGPVSSYKALSSTTATTMGWYSQIWRAPNIAHVAIVLREDKTYSFTETVLFGDTMTVVKGYLVTAVDAIVLTESFTFIRKVLMSFTDTINLQEKGWFGTVENWVEGVKDSISTWVNQDKND